MRARLSQVFLVNPRTIEAMIQQINPKPGQVFLEVGPGKGALTKPLIKQGVLLYAMEIDQKLLQELEREMSLVLGKRFFPVPGDFLKHKLDFLPKEPVRFVSNLPYHISNPGLLRLCQLSHIFQDAHLLVQKEFADRLMARPGSKSYGFTSVAVQLVYTLQAFFTVSPGCFKPRPKVQSKFIGLEPRQDRPGPTLYNRALKIARTAFLNRRKTLENALRSAFGQDTRQRIDRAGLDPGLRPDHLSPEEYLRLALSWQDS